VDPATLKEAVTHHALPKQKKENCQNDDQHERSDSERGWLWFCRGSRIRIGCHRSCVSAKTGACHGTAVLLSIISRVAI